MRKSLLIVVILSAFSISAFGQDMKPVRLEAGFSAGMPAISAEYVFPINPVSLGVDIGVIFDTNIAFKGFETALRLYPLNANGKGLYTSAEYMMNPFEDPASSIQKLSLCAGYRFNFLKIVTLRIGAGYQFWFSQVEGNRTSQFIPDLMLGLAF